MIYKENIKSLGIVNKTLRNLAQGENIFLPNHQSTILSCFELQLKKKLV